MHAKCAEDRISVYQKLAAIIEIDEGIEEMFELFVFWLCLF